MNRTALTLTELIVVMMVGAILIAVVTVQFVMMTGFKTDMGDKAYVIREARLIMSHMSRVLRFAQPGTLYFVEDANTQKIYANIRKGHISMVTESEGDKVCYYKRVISEDGFAPNDFCFAKGEGSTTWQVIGRGVTFFDVDNTGNRLWDPDTKLLTLRFTVTKNSTSIPVETTIRVMGEE